MTELLTAQVPWARTMIEALLNGGAQGIVLTVVIATVLRIGPRWSASARYAIWSAALLMVVALPLLAGAKLSSLRSERSAAETVTFASAPAASMIGTEARARAHGGPPPSRIAIPLPGGGWAAALVALLALGSARRMMRLGLAMRRIPRLRARSRPFDAPVPISLPAEGRSRRIELRLSDEITTPMAIGFVRPAVLLPAGLLAELTEDELRQIVLHEVTHLRRRDDWAILVQRIAEALFFFHPAVRWIGRKLELEREFACDDQVIAELGGERRYAECLIRLASRRNPGALSYLAAGAAARPKHLVARVEALLSPRTDIRLTPSRMAALPLPVLLLALAAWTILPPIELVEAADGRGPTVAGDGAAILLPAAAVHRSAISRPSTETVDAGLDRMLAASDRVEPLSTGSAHEPGLPMEALPQPLLRLAAGCPAPRSEAGSGCLSAPAPHLKEIALRRRVQPHIPARRPPLLTQISRGIAAAGLSVSVATPAGPGAEVADYLYARNTTVLRFAPSHLNPIHRRIQ